MARSPFDDLLGVPVGEPTEPWTTTVTTMRFFAVKTVCRRDVHAVDRAVAVYRAIQSPGKARDAAKKAVWRERHIEKARKQDREAKRASYDPARKSEAARRYYLRHGDEIRARVAARRAASKATAQP